MLVLEIFAKRHNDLLPFGVHIYKGCKTQFMFSIEDMDVRDTQVL